MYVSFWALSGHRMLVLRSPDFERNEKNVRTSFQPFPEATFGHRARTGRQVYRHRTASEMKISVSSKTRLRRARDAANTAAICTSNMSGRPLSRLVYMNARLKRKHLECFWHSEFFSILSCSALSSGSFAAIRFWFRCRSRISSIGAAKSNPSGNAAVFGANTSLEKL